MQYAFPPDVAEFVKAELTSGRYQTEDDVVRGAMQALKRQQTECAAIQEGIDDMEAGRFRSLDEADRLIREKHGYSST